MFKFFKSDFGIISLIIALFFILLPFFFLHQGLLLIDTGREFYIPQQMLNGEILYKDIYNIYGAFAYQINALLFKIFGIEFNTIYFAGIFNSLIIVLSIYLISREFLEKNISSFICIVVMFSLVFNTFLYNSNVPYTYTIAYALSSFLLSVLFLIKYIKTKQTKMAYLSCLFCGISLSNKYEFSLMPLIIVYTLTSIKPIGIKNALKALGCFLVAPFLSYGMLFFQGVNIDTIKDNIQLLKNLTNAPLIKMFFEKFGIFFNLQGIINLTISSKEFAIFGFLPTINILLLITRFKKIYENKSLFVLILCSISASAKSFFFLNVQHMGAFIFPICLVGTCLLIKNKNIIKITLLASILLFASNDFSSLKYKNYNLNGIYTYKKDGEPIKTACDYILENTKNTDKVVIMPEGSFINFITKRKGDSFYYNLSPLFYKDVFTEKRILNHFEKNLPEYFVILPIDNREYGSRFFGIDYAQNFYEMIVNSYDLVEEKNNIKIFRKKI